MPRIVCISDTHGQHRNLDLPKGDFLVHAGDLTSNGKLAQTIEAATWLNSLVGKYKHVVAIAGNHDWALQAFMTEKHEDAAKHLFGRAVYLRDEGVTLEGIYLYGSPQTPNFCDWAFNVERGLKIKRYWDKIPLYTHVLITHGPPMGILDRVGKEHVGCADLRVRVEEVKPTVHVFGHIHCGYGLRNIRGEETLYVNASSCDEAYHIKNEPIVVEI